jgi:hypothetical protein
LKAAVTGGLLCFPDHNVITGGSTAARELAG